MITTEALVEQIAAELSRRRWWIKSFGPNSREELRFVARLALTLAKGQRRPEELEDSRRIAALERLTNYCTTIALGPDVRGCRFIVTRKMNHFGDTLREAIDVAEKEAL